MGVRELKRNTPGKQHQAQFDKTKGKEVGTEMALPKSFKERRRLLTEREPV